MFRMLSADLCLRTIAWIASAHHFRVSSRFRFLLGFVVGSISGGCREGDEQE